MVRKVDNSSSNSFQDEKYLLKFHTGSGVVSGGGRDDAKKIHSPVIKLVPPLFFYQMPFHTSTLSLRFTTMLVRPVATNKRAFYLMNTTQVREREKCEQNLKENQLVRLEPSCTSLLRVQPMKGKPGWITSMLQGS